MRHAMRRSPSERLRLLDIGPPPVTPRPRRRRRRWLRAWFIVLVCLPVLAFALGSLLAVLEGRTILPVFQRNLALNALATARQAETERWAPDVLARAEASYQSATREQIHQASLMLPFQNFHRVAAAYDSVAAQAQAAQRLALARRAQAMAQADSAMSDATAELEIADDVARGMLLPRLAHMRLQDAHLALEEARVLRTEQEFAVAESLAQVSLVRAEEAWRLALPVASRFTDQAQLATWRSWINDTIAWSRSQGQPAIIVYKEKNLLALYDKGREVRTCRADMGRNNLQPKIRANDTATPEGRYKITKKKDVGSSRYHRALLLDYPNAQDRERFARAKRRGELPASATIGAMIEIHGEGGKGINWTRGCVAISNSDMNDLFRRVTIGTPVVIVGGDGSNGAYSDIVRRLSNQNAEQRP
jgi:lipoprotein-anchoring transpeptidase ErfK/SrfK